MLNDLNTEQLAKIGLVRDGADLSISVPDDANIYAMTVGAQMAAGNGERVAMIFEQPDGVTTLTFGEVDRAATRTCATWDLDGAALWPCTPATAPRRQLPIWQSAR